MLKYFRQFACEEDGQGISEYAAVLAFVCLLIITVFHFTQGGLAFAISQSHSSLVNQFDRLNNATANANPT